MKKYFACLALFAVMYVGCSDYLDEFKDEYEDQFAQKVDEPKDDEISSDSHDPVMSSGIENKNSSDSKDLKSSSSGKGSSSGSSSSVAGEDAANRCSGTVIYDVSVNPSQTVFGSHFKYAGRGEGYVPADENGLNMELAPGIFATLVFDETRDVSSWKGICIEYTAESTTDLSFTNSNKNGQVAAFFKISPSSKLQKYEAKWENANKVGDFDFKAVSTINFGDCGANLVVSRITTIADVDLSSNSSKFCDGTVIYSPESGAVGSGFFRRKDGLNDWLDSTSTGVLSNIDGDDGPWLWFNGNTENYAGYDISNWGGLCVEYSSDQNFSLRVQSLQEESPSKYPYASVALDSGAHRAKKLVWDSWNSSSEKNAVIKSANSLNFYGENDLQGTIKIERITTVNKVGTLFARNCSKADSTCFYWNGKESVNMKDARPDSAWVALIPSDSESRLLTEAGDTLGGKIGSQIIPNSAFVGCDGICGTFIPKNGTYVQVSLSRAFAADLTKEDGICMSYLSSADHTVFILSKETSQGYFKMSGNLEKATSVKMVNVKWSDLSKDFFSEVTFENFFEGDVIISVNLQGNFQENVKFNIFEIGSYGTCKGVYEVPDWFKSN